MRAACALLALGAVLAGLCVGWVDAGQAGSERLGETTVEHIGRPS